MREDQKLLVCVQQVIHMLSDCLSLQQQIDIHIDCLCLIHIDKTSVEEPIKPLTPCFVMCGTDVPLVYCQKATPGHILKPAIPWVCTQHLLLLVHCETCNSSDIQAVGFDPYLDESTLLIQLHDQPILLHAASAPKASPLIPFTLALLQLARLLQRSLQSFHLCQLCLLKLEEHLKNSKLFK